MQIMLANVFAFLISSPAVPCSIQHCVELFRDLLVWKPVLAPDQHVHEVDDSGHRVCVGKHLKRKQGCKTHARSTVSLMRNVQGPSNRPDTLNRCLPNGEMFALLRLAMTVTAG